jgi:hypothetical protein
MPSTYYLHQQYGTISPSESGTNLYAQTKFYPAPVIQQATTNSVYVYDSTSDYGTFSLTGLSGYYDSQFGMRGVGSARYILDGSTPTPNIRYPSSSYYDTGVTSYKTGSLYIWSEHALTFRLDMQLRDGSDTQVGGVDSTTVTLTPNKWNRIETITGANAQKFLMTLNVLNFTAGTDTGKTFYVDSVQVENIRFATSFHNSGSRLQSQISFTLPKQAPDYTVTCWAKVGNHVTTAAQGMAPFFTLYNNSTDYSVLRYNEGTTRLEIFKDDTDPNTNFSTTPLELNPGDLVFVALVNDGLTITTYIGKQGGSLISANGSTDFNVYDTIYIGQDPVNSNWLNGPVENLLIHKKALDSTAIGALFAASNPTLYKDSQDIILAYATPDTLGTSKAMAYTGSSSYRYKNSTVSLDIIPASSMSANSESVASGATHMVYGSDVDKLELNGYITTNVDLTLAVMYKVVSIMDVPGIGKSAYVVRG